MSFRGQAAYYSPALLQDVNEIELVNYAQWQVGGQ